MSRFLALLVLLCGAVAGLWYFYAAQAETQYDIQSVEASRGSIERSVSATGSVEALVTADVSSQLSGQVSEISVDFNSPVKKGDILAVIDQRTFASKVASAQANLAIGQTTLDVQQANIVKSKALAEQAQKTVERQRALAARDATPLATLETAETAVATAKADVEVAVADLATAKATIAQREADLAQAKLDLDRTELRSPIDGVVIARNIDQGATVAASLQAPVLFQIAQDLSQIQILALVDEADIGAIETGNDVTFTVDAFPDQVFNGKVKQVRIAGTTTNNVVTYTVVVGAGNPRLKLLPGMTATVRIITGTRRDVLRVPNEAVRFTPPGGLKTAGPAERPDRDDAIVATLAEKLKLTPEQVEKLNAGLDATKSGGTGASGAGGGRRHGGDAAAAGASGGEHASSGAEGRRGNRSAGSRGGRSSGQGRVTRVLEGILTPEQMKQFLELRAEHRESTRPALVWSPGPNGLAPHRILLGLSDESFSEVLRGDLKEGDKIVTRARTISGESGGGGEGARRRRS